MPNNLTDFFHFFARLRKIMQRYTRKVSDPAFYTSSKGCRLWNSSSHVALILVNDIANRQGEPWRWRLAFLATQGGENCTRRNICDLMRPNQELAIIALQSVE